MQLPVANDHTEFPQVSPFTIPRRDFKIQRARKKETIVFPLPVKIYPLSVFISSDRQSKNQRNRALCSPRWHARKESPQFHPLTRERCFPSPVFTRDDCFCMGVIGRVKPNKIYALLLSEQKGNLCNTFRWLMAVAFTTFFNIIYGIVRFH